MFRIIHRCIQITLLSVLAISSGNAFASGVFKCVDAEGNTSFSFTSCPIVNAPVIKLADASVETLQKEPSNRSVAANLDYSITSIQSELDEIKRDYEANLLTTSRDGRSDNLTDTFDLETSALFAELSRLQAEKANLPRR